MSKVNAHLDFKLKFNVSWRSMLNVIKRKLPSFEEEEEEEEEEEVRVPTLKGARTGDLQERVQAFVAFEDEEVVFWGPRSTFDLCYIDEGGSKSEEGGGAIHSEHREHY